MNEPQEMTARILAADSSVVAGTSFLLHAIYAPETIVLQSIHWEPAELFPKQDTLRQQISISRSTDFSVELTDDHGCSARAERGMGVKKPNLYFPNALKLGSENDAYFTVFAGEGVESILYLRIYNRVGAAIFERFNFQPNEPAKGWNGRWAEKDVQPGVYIWAVSIKYLDGTEELREGTVTVLE